MASSLYQFNCLVKATSTTPSRAWYPPDPLPRGTKLPAGAELNYPGIETIDLPAGLTIAMDDAQAAKIIAAAGPYTGNVPKKSLPDWTITPAPTGTP